MKIEVKELSRKYGDKLALDHVSFTLGEPKIYGLLSRNGAGKTTFMDILAGYSLQSSGEILVNSEKPFDNAKLTASICLIKEANNFKRDLKIKDVLHMYAYFYPTWDGVLAEELIDVYQLNRHAKIKTLSKGMVSALGIIVGLASRAPITIFDEPYIGMDASARKQFYEILLDEYETRKRTIILSTHLIDEASMLFEEVLILRKGSLVLQEDAELLRNNACAVTGAKQEVEAFLHGKEIFGKKELAGMMTAYVFDSKTEAQTKGLKVEGVPFQDLMIYLTEGQKGA